MAVALTYVYIATHRISASVLIKVIRYYVDQVKDLRNSICLYILLKQSIFPGEFEISSRPSETADYLETGDEEGHNSGDDNESDTSSQARLVLIAIAISGGLLIIVVSAILCKLNLRHVMRYKCKLSFFLLLPSQLAYESIKQTEKRLHSHFRVPNGMLSRYCTRHVVFVLFEVSYSNFFGFWFFLFTRFCFKYKLGFCFVRVIF